MLFLFSVVFATLGVALGKVSIACPAWCVSDGLLNGQHLVRVGTYSDSSLLCRSWRQKVQRGLFFFVRGRVSGRAGASLSSPLTIT
jgi:hypothetical protein